MNATGTVKKRENYCDTIIFAYQKQDAFWRVKHLLRDAPGYSWYFRYYYDREVLELCEKTPVNTP